MKMKSVSPLLRACLTVLWISLKIALLLVLLRNPVAEFVYAGF